MARRVIDQPTPGRLCLDGAYALDLARMALSVPSFKSDAARGVGRSFSDAWDNMAPVGHGLAADVECRRNFVCCFCIEDHTENFKLAGGKVLKLIPEIEDIQLSAESHDAACQSVRTRRLPQPCHCQLLRNHRSRSSASANVAQMWSDRPLWAET
jgi:hypothetical protein